MTRCWAWPSQADTLPERCEHLLRKAADDGQADALEVLCLYKLIEVDGQKFKSDAQVAAEGKALLNVDDVVHILRVVHTQMLQHP
jgi:hypothetical protein